MVVVTHAKAGDQNGVLFSKSSEKLLSDLQMRPKLSIEARDQRKFIFLTPDVSTISEVRGAVGKSRLIRRCKRAPGYRVSITRALV